MNLNHDLLQPIIAKSWFYYGYYQAWACHELCPNIFYNVIELKYILYMLEF
jgi:hypothetical protein